MQNKGKKTVNDYSNLSPNPSLSATSSENYQYGMLPNYFAGQMWHPRCLHISVAYLLYIMCLFCLKKDLFVIIKGYMCNIHFMQGSFYSLIWIECVIIAFVEGVFAKCGVIITWQEIFQISLSLKWNCFEFDKIPGIQNSFYVFKIISWILDQINFCTTSKL